MWHDLLRVSGTEVADRLVPLDQLWGKRARELAVRLDNADKPVEMGNMILEALPQTVETEDGIRSALNAIERSRGRFPLRLAAKQAGYCSRQFRRRCLEATGLQPKLLIRILRFRHAADSIAFRPGNYAALAFECGYSDQSHLIADFREFAGQTPREMARRFSSRESKPEHLAGRFDSVSG